MNERPEDQLASLESPSTVVEQPGFSSSKPPTRGVVPPPAHQLDARKWLAQHINMYLVVFAVLLVGSIIALVMLARQSGSSSNDVLPQALSSSALDRLTTNDVNVGEPQHTLSVQSNAIFTGDVLVRRDLQIAGNLQVGSSLAIAGLRVTGNSTFDDVQITKSLALTGNGSIQGQLNIQQGLQVNGSGTFLGTVSANTLSATNLQLTGDLTLTHHVVAGGATPGRSNGPALGSGGTVSMSGSDTAGTITVNTGSSPTAGCFVTVNFVTKFTNTPRLALTPIGAAAAGLGLYATRSSSSFSVCVTVAPPASTSLAFDYIALD